VGAAILALPDPRHGLLLFAVLDLALLAVVLRALPAAPAAARTARPARRARTVPAAVLAVTTLAVGFELAANVVRPFFTAYAQDAGLGLGAAAALFLLPSAAALATLPLAGAARAALGRSLLPWALLAAAAGLALQAAVPDLLALVGGRVLLGAGLALAHVELDRAMFAAVGTDGAGYAGVEVARGVALTLAPLIAAGLATDGLALPLAAGSALVALVAALAPALTTAPTLEETHAPTR
jgi:hypothetical protein